jgi:U-box domain
MFFCAISGEPPLDPVVSAKSGHVYERRLITKYIAENGTDPMTGEKLEENDLISVKAGQFRACLKYYDDFFPNQYQLEAVDELLALIITFLPEYLICESRSRFANELL